MQISRVTKCYDKKVFRCKLSDVLNEIKSDAYKEKIMRIRRAKVGAETFAKAIKKELPAFTGAVYSSEATSRTIENINYSQVFILDIDHLIEPSEKALDNPSDINYLRNDLEAGSKQKDASIIYTACRAMFRSPSGDGIKLIYVLDHKVEESREYSRIWKYLAKELNEVLNIQADMATKDMSRLCYFSYDPYIYINDKAVLKYDEIQNYLEMSDEAPQETILIKDDTQREYILGVVKNYIKKSVFTYKLFRDLCSAASNLGEKFLSAFYDELYANNVNELSDETRKALQNKRAYIKSFMSEHKRIPLQHIFDIAAQNKDFSLKPILPKSGNRNAYLFNYSKVIRSVREWMNERFASYNYGDSIIILPDKQNKKYYSLSNNEPTGQSTQAIRMARRINFKEDMKNRNIYYWSEKGTLETKSYYDLWWNWEYRRRANSIICYPYDKDEPGIINTWQGFNIDPERMEIMENLEKETIEPICQPILDFIFDTICSKSIDDYEFLLNWMADIVQNPTPKKPGISVILRSNSQGTGKGTFALIMQDMIGLTHSTKVQDVDKMLKQFNSIVENKLLVVLDEALFAGDKRQVKKLMTIVTEPTVTIEKKGVDSYETDNIMRILILTNERHVVDIPVDDRRFFALNVNDNRKDDIAFFGMIRSCMGNYGKESLYKYLMNRRYTFKDLRLRDHINQAMIEQKRQSLTSVEQWVVSLLERQHLKTFSDDRRWLASGNIGTDVTLTDLWYDFEMTYNVKRRHPINYQQFCIQVRDLGILSKIGRRKDKAGIVKTHYNLMGLNKLAETYPHYCPMDWEPLDLIITGGGDNDYSL